MDEAKMLIERLALTPHPEGGWYRETWRGPPGPDGRATGTAIYFLLEAGQGSHWHRIDAAETWFWHAGAPIRLRVAPCDGTVVGPVSDIQLGPDPLAGHEPQGLVPAHGWQAAQADDGWALVSCVVLPGFEFASFELAPPGWQPGDHISG